MNLRILLLAVLLLAPVSACKSHSTTTVPCTCGTPMGDLEGCAHPSCMNGKPNPDNPNCVCGKIEVPNGKTN